MPKNIKGDLGLMKEINRALILGVIKEFGPLSRAEVAEKTRLNPSTVTRIVGELIAEGYVAEVGFAESSGGRRPILINLVAEAAYVMGIDVEVGQVIGIITNLIGKIVLKLEKEIKHTDKDEVFNLIKDLTIELQTRAAEENFNLIGIGVAMHGLVDSVRGIVLYPPAFGWKDLPLAELLTEITGLPVKLENNARAMALGENWFGLGIGLNNFICLKIGQEIGSGMFFNGEIFKGIDESAGEIGHTTVMIDGPRCECGNYGCLECLASVKAMVRNVKRWLKEGIHSKILQLTDGQINAISIEHIIIAAREGDELALRVLDDAGRYLGIAIANLVNLLNPTKVLLGGDVWEGLEFIIPRIREMVDVRAMELPSRRVQIESVYLGTEAVSLGAVTLILRHIFHR